MKSTRYFPLLFFVFAISSCKKDEKLEPASPHYVPQTRIYYIAADEVLWNYAPNGMNTFMGMAFDETDSVYAVNTPNTLGRICYKAKYREYTDSTFSNLKTIAPEWQHLGILGPVIRGNVGDSILVYFKNNTTINTSLHAHGIQYVKSSEGSGYNDSTNGEGSSIPPGGKYTYKYFVRNTAGPVSGQSSSLAWLYHSHVDMGESDVYAGLMGAIIITDPNYATTSGRPSDIQREFVTLFMVIDENASSYLDKNILQFTPSVDRENEEFDEGNKKHTINGMLMGNLPGLTMNKGENVRWYVMSLGNEVDNHTPHWHGNTVTINGERTDVIEILPASMKIADMIPDNQGIWAYHCHVTDHMMAGMTALYEVK